MDAQLASVAVAATLTVVVIFVLLVGAGFWLISRRKGRGGPPNAITAMQQKANILLVRADDVVKNAEDELAFAVAQFGEATAREFELVLASAKKELREAFALQQKLDDAYPDSETQRRDWSARIVHACEKVTTAVEEKEKEFASLREREKNGPADLATVQSALAAVEARIPGAKDTLARLHVDYVDAALSTVSDTLERVARETTRAEVAIGRADGILKRVAAGEAATGAGDAIREAGEHVHRADQLLDTIDTLRDELGKAADAVGALRDATRANLAEARALRDAPPDAEASASVGRAIQTVESALATHRLLADPLTSLEVLRAANSELDTSMAGARNQQRRLDGARTALAGALVGARSQLTATRDFVTTRRGGVGAEARTRLAEAERLLAVAEAEADPVAALDLARSSATYSRDADALARYDLLGR